MQVIVFPFVVAATLRQRLASRKGAYSLASS